MPQKFKIAKAVALAISGAALSLGAVSAQAGVTTMYNMTSAAGADIYGNGTNPTGGTDGTTQVGPGPWALWAGNTDGWTNGYTNPSVGDGTGAAKWVGTTGLNNTPFGYTGAHLNWAVDVTGTRQTGEISTFDAFNKYGMYADVDTAKGAWAATNTGTVFGGWRHDLDTGLFRSDGYTTVTLTATGILNPTNSNFGFTIFKGMDSVTDYNHHGQWNNNNNSTGLTSNSLPGGTLAGVGFTTAQIVAYSVGAFPSNGNTTTNINTISFKTEPGQIYTIFIGGYRNGTWGDTVDGYRLNFSVVPEPATYMLFTAALAGFGIKGRRKATPSV